MRKTITDEKMVRIISEAAEVAVEAAVAEVAKKHGVSDQTIYPWRRRFGTMGVDDAKRPKGLVHARLNVFPKPMTDTAPELPGALDRVVLRYVQRREHRQPHGEAENAELEKHLVDRMLDIAVLKDINSRKW